MNWNLIQYFTQDEMACPCCGRCDMDLDYMMRLDWMRRNCGFPIPVNSGFRCSDYDKTIRGAGVHPTGHGVDLGIYGYRAYKVLSLATRAGFTGIGISQKGPRPSRFVHLDDLPEIPGVRPRSWIWSY